MFSVIIPAYNEASVIDRCLSAMLADARPGELQIVVVANNCSDDTAARARRHGSLVEVVETPIGSKIHALNLGDDTATGWPRLYVDADIVVSTDALRDVAAMLGEDSPLVVAAPTAVVDYSDRSSWVQSFYKVWTQLPYFTEGVIGAGFYAFSKKGRERFGRWPDIIADDEYARLMAAPHERGVTPHHTFTITPPTKLRMVAKIQTRARAGLYQLHEKFPELLRNETTSPARTLQVLAGRPDLWMHAPIYLGVMSYAKMMAHRKLRQGKERVWERDETARVAGA
ncbi:glycosyltransferase [Paraliomyxa miuraensis]|uniref:glycosyltransferase n=1 Tax=Paraliomyxa miuraensis TaxID=376150 RepID=UPI002252B3D2|nr:glycosyltransferase [Paraliomyxa miuraensis]MCX4247707.1 glycosyltransferase [Paraliomyxa miuraensis]